MENSIERAICSIIGSIIQKNDVILDIGLKLKPSDIVNTSLRAIYSACFDIYSSDGFVDRTTIEYRLNYQIDDATWSVIVSSGDIGKLPMLIHIVCDYALKRKIRNTVSPFMSSDESFNGKTGEEILAVLSNKVDLLADSSVSEDNVQRYADIIPDYLEEYKNRVESGSTMIGEPTGLQELDLLISGLSPGLYILAARPSMGKSTLALNIVDNFAAEGGSAHVFTLEMKKKDLLNKTIASRCGVNLGRLRNGKLTDLEYQKMSAGMKAISELDVHVDDESTLTITDLRLKAKKKHRKSKTGLLVLDYLQLLSFADTDAATESERISFATRNLKLLSDELNCPIIALSQLNRSLEHRPDKRPINSDLRGSGSIEQDADVILFVYRDEYYNEDSPDKGLAELIVGKQRNGALGTVFTSFQGELSRFVSYKKTEVLTLSSGESPPQSF